MLDGRTSFGGSQLRLEWLAGKPWLTIGIPTIPRKNQTDYLTRTLSSLMEEVPLDPTDPMHRQVRVIVMNNRPGAHPVWEQARTPPPPPTSSPCSETAASVTRQNPSIRASCSAARTMQQIKERTTGGGDAHHALVVQVRDRVHRQGAAEDEQDLFVKKGRLYLEFVDNPGTVADPTPNAVDPDDNNNPTNRPGRCCQP